MVFIDIALALFLREQPGMEQFVTQQTLFVEKNILITGYLSIKKCSPLYSGDMLCIHLFDK